MSTEQDQAADLAIQGTNTSSITSKRSLERLGYLDPCHVPGVTEKDSPLMLKYMVPKPSRRSPVINRAYYQRTESIRILVEGWIEDCESKGIEQCVVISIGCGFDPTFFRLATLRKAKVTRTKLKYIDIDYPTLITERLYMVRTQDALRNLLPQNPTIDDISDFVSDAYSCIGIDLRDLKKLKVGLEAAGVVPGLPILVISEVVLSYLDADESDAVIEFFGAYPDATFILHEQCIPTFDAENEQNLHPFALTMFRHFQRTMTPLKTLQKYRSLQDHRDRFKALGWSNCDLLNMSLFSDFVTMPTEEEHQRIALLEPFDEYDELYWIGAYYFIAIATTNPSGSMSGMALRNPNVIERIGLRSKLQTIKAMPPHYIDQETYTNLQDEHIEATISPTLVSEIDWAKQSPFQDLEINRKGHTLSILGDEAFVFGGFGIDADDHQEATKVFQARGQQTRLNSMMRLNLIDGSAQTFLTGSDGPAPRMYHSAVTTLDGSAIYVYGGRDGPNKVHNDVWRYSPTEGWDPMWRARVSNEGESPVPKGLYKHTANMMTIGDREMMVVFGGRVDTGEANNQVWAFDLQECQWGHFKWRSSADGVRLPFPKLFSHSAVVVSDENNQDSLLVMGGIQGADEKVINSVWRITLGVSEDDRSCWVEAKELNIRADSGKLLPPRFGHTSVALDEDRVWIIGGVSAPGLLKWQETIIEIRPKENKFQYLHPSIFKGLVMVGHATALDASRGQIIGVGGGGTCFGFGAWWDTVGWALLV